MSSSASWVVKDAFFHHILQGFLCGVFKRLSVAKQKKTRSKVEMKWFETSVVLLNFTD